MTAMRPAFKSAFGDTRIGISTSSAGAPSRFGEDRVGRPQRLFWCVRPSRRSIRQIAEVETVTP